MSGAEYWLADSEARVLGPIGFEVITTLHARGKLHDVRAVSKDGKRFVPLREMPELQAVLRAPVTATDANRAQEEATKQIRDWLTAIRERPTTEVFKVPAGSSRDAWRAAFFSLVHRYVPSRLPADATPELRLACEDAFLILSARMIEIEKQFQTPPPAPSTHPAPIVNLTLRKNTVHVQLGLRRGDARVFTQDLEHTWQTDCLFIPTVERVNPGMELELVISFEGHVTQLHATGRVLAGRVGGFTAQLARLGEAERGLIRTWVARATTR